MRDSRTEAAPLPIIDLHCDLLSYLVTVEGATPDNAEDIGCALPFLREGNVKLQVLASYVPTEPHCVGLAAGEYELFKALPSNHTDVLHHVTTPEQTEQACQTDGTGIVAAIENASALCTELEPLELAFPRLEKIIEQTGRVLYITLTHHSANRFGGGNMTDIGLSEDGKSLINHLNGMGIAVDLSHTSDELARGILDHIDGVGLDVPILASHSNFREVYHHVRNLPDWLAKEIVNRGGVIGINFIRAFVHMDDPSYLKRHVLHGHEIGVGDGLCFGADFFYWQNTLDQGRIPFYHSAHEDAGRYQEILSSFGPELGREEKQALACGNALRFLGSIWR